MSHIIGPLREQQFINEIAKPVRRRIMRFVRIKAEEQLDLQAVHRVRERCVRRRTAVRGEEENEGPLSDMIFVPESTPAFAGRTIVFVNVILRLVPCFTMKKPRSHILEDFCEDTRLSFRLVRGIRG
jgi:hypothetical protein